MIGVGDAPVVWRENHFFEQVRQYPLGALARHDVADERRPPVAVVKLDGEHVESPLLARCGGMKSRYGFAIA